MVLPAKSAATGELKAYYQAKIEAAELTINQKTQNLRRLEAQRNALNARGVCGWPLVLLRFSLLLSSALVARGAPAAARAR